MKLIKKFAYPIAKNFDALLIRQVKEAIKVLDFGEHASLQELQDFRLDALKKLITHVNENVPYYRNAFDKHGIRPDQIQTLEDIKKLPILTKEDIRSAGSLLGSINLDKMKYIITRSGGTTGEPIASYINKKAQALGTYAYLRGLEWMGWKPGVPMITLFGGSLHRPNARSLRTRIREYALGTVFLPAFELTKENTPEYLSIIKKNSPCVIKGYASAIYNLALYAQELNVKNIPIKSVFCTAEYLPDQWATLISEVFECPVKGYYGCGEINSLGFQVEQAGPYIVPDEHVIIESVDIAEQGIVTKNTLLVTALFNYAQPLIRYKLGDIGNIWAPGTRHPTRSTITNLVGRTSDMFMRKDGTTISPSLAPHIIAKTKLPVIKYQFIQTGLNTIQFLYDTVDYDLSTQEKMEVSAILRSHLSEDVDVSFIRTQDFVLSNSGKFRIVISHLI